MPLKYQEVKERIKKIAIESKVGSKLASRNFLSRKYEVARNTVDKAIAELEEEGYLLSVKGSGTYVSDKKPQRSLNIGVIMPSLVGDIYPKFISGIEKVASAYNINIIVSSSDNFPEKQHENVMRIIKMQADGCIIIPTINSEKTFETFQVLERKKIPFVVCNRSIDGLDAPFVGVNNHYGAYIAARHLAEGGCRILSYFSSHKYSTSIDRYCGFETALTQYQEKVKKGPVILGNYEEAVLKEKIRAVYEKEEYPDGVVCFDDAMGAALYGILQEKGLLIGDDVKVTGYDDSGICLILPVPLTSVSPEAVEMGKEAVKILRSIIEGTGEKDPFYLIQPRLIVRKSSGGK
ncbi:MAG: LacI family DNA-binding transcriptional regulator [Eubacteriales bacterium]|nr:LacI family DNA-binding transcriptional regulator [Eubacteriales bacterium]